MRRLAVAVSACPIQSTFSTCRKLEIASQWRRHVSSSSTAAQPQNIGILGGGISGLSTAMFTLIMHEKKYPGAKLPKLTIYEASDQLGGWMQTSKVVPGPGLAPVYMEQGPRTIRLASFGGSILASLVRSLAIYLISIR